MADAIVRYPARGQAPEIYATRLKFVGISQGQVSSCRFELAGDGVDGGVLDISRVWSIVSVT